MEEKEEKKKHLKIYRMICELSSTKNIVLETRTCCSRHDSVHEFNSLLTYMQHVSSDEWDKADNTAGYQREYQQYHQYTTKIVAYPPF